MIRIRQIEINALTFNQYDNGISEIKYHESTDRAVDGFYRFLDMIIRETPHNKTVYLLSDLTDTDSLPLADHYSKIARINSKYEPGKRPKARFANLYEEVSLEKKMILAYMESLKMPGVAINMFSIDERSAAIAWLLSAK